MHERDVAAVYDQVADDYADHFPSTEPEQQVDLAVVAHFASLLPAPRDVLDAGCGAGRMLPVLGAAGCRAAGIDLSPGMVRRARRDHPGAAVCTGSLTALPFAAGSFDGVFAWYSTIHLPDERLAAAVTEARRVLRPGGHLLVAFQVGEGVRDVSQGYRRLGHEVALWRHDRAVDPVAAALRAAGFVEVARLVRAPAGTERTHQAVLVARS